MAVGFDIDDTVLFLQPRFWRGKKHTHRTAKCILKTRNSGKDEQRLGRIQHPKVVARLSPCM